MGIYTPIHDPKKCNILLDLDMTLIESSNPDEIDMKDVKVKAKLQGFDFKNMDDVYVVVGRPGLQKFLDFLFANFNVSVWTAASKDYALFIIDHFMLTNDKRELDFVLFDHHCDISEDQVGEIKKISLLWSLFNMVGYTRSNTLIIDDNIEDVYNHQPSSVVKCSQFVFSDDKSEEDDYFERLMPLLMKFKNECDMNCDRDLVGDHGPGPAEMINRMLGV